VFSYEIPISSLNTDNVRQLNLDINARSQGDNSTWLFAILNLQSGNYDNLGTLTPGQTWTQGYVGEFDYLVPSYVTSGGRVSLRVSSTTATTPFLVDQLSFRPYVPDQSALQVIRALSRNVRLTFNF